MSSIFRLALVFQAIIGLWSASAAQAGEDRELLELVRDGHRAARESIHTLSCGVKFTLTITQKSKPPVTQSCSSQYWLSTKVMRAKISDNNEDLDCLWDNSVRQSVLRREIGGQLGASAGRRHFTHRHLKRCDPFVRGLMALNLPNTIDYMPFEELIDLATKLKKAERTRAGSKELILVQLYFDSSKGSGDSWTVDIFFDPAANYLIRQIAYLSAMFRRKEEVLEFKEYQPGLFFPERVVGSSQLLPSEAKHADREATFSNIRINQPLPQGIFDFKYPNGIFLRDQIRGCEYQVDAEGNQISQAIPIGREPLPPGMDGDASQAFGTETQEEPLPWSRWILPISFGLLVTGSVAVFLRRRKRQAESA